MVNSKFKKRILVIVAMLALLLSGVTAIADTYDSASAGMICGDVGSSMGRSSISGSAANETKPNREWTAEELFRGSVSYSRFFGEREGSFLYKDTSGRGEGVTGYEEVKETLQADGLCFSLNIIPNFMIGTTEMITGLTGGVVLSLIGKDEMSETLTTIVGGEGGDDEGLIGTFFSSFYMPLVLLAAAIMAVTVIYKGLIQFKLREALSSIIWSVSAFIVGVALMLNPQLLAGIPQAATSTITTCVIGAISGQNCMTGDVETPSVLSGAECQSSVSHGSDSESVVNSLNCTIWKSFVLEPWAEVQFGEPYSDLYTGGDIPTGGQEWSNMPEENDANDYCINFSSSKSFANSVGSTVRMDGTETKICNVALYHLFLKTNMRDPVLQAGNNFSPADEYDKRWYHIAIPMASDTSKWGAWSGSDDFGSRVSTSFMSLIAIIASSSVLLVLAVFGGAYKVIGTILIAFSPVFLLFAVEPTRGRRIFLGWLETLVSSILKYFAITVLVVVALIMYSGLLSNTSGVTSLIGIIVLTVALHMYRKEIVDLIGASNMGGERLSNKAADVGKVAKEKSAAFAGGAIGGASGNLLNRRSRIKSRKETIKDLEKKSNAEGVSEEEKKFYEEEIAKEKELSRKESGIPVIGMGTSALKGTFSGGGESFGRSMKRGTGVTANIFQQRDRTKSSLKSDNEYKAQDAENKSIREKFEAERSAEELKNKAVATATDNDNEDNKEEEINEANVTQEISDEDINLEIEKERMKEPEVKFDDNLSDSEKRSLEDLSKELTESNDEDLMRIFNDTEMMKDPNKQKLVDRELKLRLNANSNLGASAGVLGATSIATANLSSNIKIDPKEVANFREMEREITGSHHSPSVREDAIEKYKDKMIDSGMSIKEVAEAAGKVSSESNKFRQEEQERIHDNLIKAVESGAIKGDSLEGQDITEENVAEVVYHEAIGVVNELDDESINREEFMSKLKDSSSITVDEKIADDLFKKMEMDGHVIPVSVESEGKDKRVAKTFEEPPIEKEKNRNQQSKPEEKKPTGRIPTFEDDSTLEEKSEDRRGPAPGQSSEDTGGPTPERRTPEQRTEYDPEEFDFEIDLDYDENQDNSNEQFDDSDGELNDELEIKYYTDDDGIEDDDETE